MPVQSGQARNAIIVSRRQVYNSLFSGNEWMMLWLKDFELCVSKCLEDTTIGELHLWQPFFQLDYVQDSEKLGRK
jgi:hypothetical protein